MNILKKPIKYILLSYIANNDTKGYGKTDVISIKKEKQLVKGNSCNTSILHIHSHTGTHMDFPRHFFNTGKTVMDYSIKDFIFTKPCFINCYKGIDELIIPEDIQKFHKQLRKSDILLLKTGFSKFRKQNCYYFNNPGITPEVAELIKKRYPNIRCVGIDTISISPYQHRDLGKKTHKKFLVEKSPILIIEDMDLRGNLELLKKIKYILVTPFYIEKLEASPCTVVGLYN